MKRALPIFERFRIRKPCPMKWEDLTGASATRFCAVCNKNVHDLGGMTPDEARALVASGRACVRVSTSAALPAVAVAAAAGVVFALSAACSGAVPDEPGMAGEPPPVTAQPAAAGDGGAIQDPGDYMMGEMMVVEPK